MAAGDGRSAARPAAPVNLARGALNVNGGAQEAGAIFDGQGAAANLGANALNIVNGGAQGGAGNAGGYALNANAGAGMPALPPAHPIFDIDEGLKGGPLRKSTTGPCFRLK